MESLGFIGLLLIFAVPLALWSLAGRESSSLQCLFIGIVIGAAIYPILFGLTTLYMYFPTGIPAIYLSQLFLPVTLLHGGAGRMIYHILYGGTPGGNEVVTVFVICGVTWAIVYGALGVIFYRMRSRSKRPSQA